MRSNGTTDFYVSIRNFGSGESYFDELYLDYSEDSITTVFSSIQILSYSILNGIFKANISFPSTQNNLYLEIRNENRSGYSISSFNVVNGNF